MAWSMNLEPMSTPQVGYLKWNQEVVPVSSSDDRYYWAALTCLVQNFDHLWNSFRRNTMAGDTYHLIAKNCNQFSNEVCIQLTGKPIPRWVNRLAQLESIQVIAVGHLPDHPACSGKHFLATMSQRFIDFHKFHANA
ncbi:putative mutt domain protein [Hibiscus syriacus]|uniref:Mutt domain protein n=1 Tax=Hibiscus syriacus TaxID=106335 RepID=A0A6A3AHS1_HIBSY|nr:putative mutt domain protein [Hibiscus syriacus]